MEEGHLNKEERSPKSRERQKPFLFYNFLTKGVPASILWPCFKSEGL